MLSTLYNMLSSASETGILKSFVSGVFAFLMTAGSLLPTNMGKHQELIAQTLSHDISRSEISFNLSVNADKLSENITLLNEHFEQEVYCYNNNIRPTGKNAGILSSPFHYSVSHKLPLGDIEFKPFPLWLPEKEIPGIYENGNLNISGNIQFTFDRINGNGIIGLDIENLSDENEYSVYFDKDNVTLSPALTKEILKIMSHGYEAVYSEYFAGEGICLKTSDVIKAVSDKYNDKIQEIIKTYFGNIFDEFDSDKTLSDFTFLSKMLSDKELCEKALTFLGHYLSPMGNNFVKRTIDGVDGYIFELYGTDYLSYRAKQRDNVKDDDVIYSFVELQNYLKSKKEYVPLSLDGTDIQLKTSDTDNIKKKFSSNALKKADICSFITENIQIRAIPDISPLFEYYKNSKIKHRIYNKDNAIHQTFEILIATKEKYSQKDPLQLISFNLECVTTESDSNIVSAKNVVSPENEIDKELFDNKLAFEKASSLGVSSLDIAWESNMTPDSIIPNISNVSFDVNYNAEYNDAAENNFSVSISENDNRLKENSTGNCSLRRFSSAFLIDGSVYLPLRQLTEHAGYEVSWDAKNYKAYVTVAGEKIEMTGKLIDSKTYVKVRDFEKLGAKVGYSEKIHYANSFDDFSKSCYATIEFQ